MKDIVFDFGGVLIDWNPRYLYRKIFASEEEMEWFLSHVCTGEWNAQQDAGRPFAEGMALLKEKYPKYSAQIEDYFLRWDEMMGGAVRGTHEILRDLKRRGYRVFGLSNWSHETFPLAQARYDVFGLLDGIILSGEEKMIKPSPEIYQHLLSRFNLQAENCVFIDDNAANIAVARQLGFDGIKFENAFKLLEELKNRELI